MTGVGRWHSQRAEQDDQIRAARVQRAQHRADTARRRYLAVDPANRLVQHRSRPEHRLARTRRRQNRLRESERDGAATSD